MHALHQQLLDQASEFEKTLREVEKGHRAELLRSQQVFETQLEAIRSGKLSIDAAGKRTPIACATPRAATPQQQAQPCSKKKRKASDTDSGLEPMTPTSPPPNHSKRLASEAAVTADAVANGVRTPLPNNATRKTTPKKNATPKKTPKSASKHKSSPSALQAAQERQERERQRERQAARAEREAVDAKKVVVSFTGFSRTGESAAARRTYGRTVAELGGRVVESRCALACLRRGASAAPQTHALPATTARCRAK